VHDSRQLFESLVERASWLRDALDLVREVGPPQAYIAAGAIRDTVWSALTGRDCVRVNGDIDVVYFDADEAADRSVAYQLQLKGADSTTRWEVSNQAFVHEWASSPPGAQRFRSVEDGLRSWPEVATAVGLRFDELDTLEIVAPLGLNDLLSLVVRPNPGCPDPAAYSARCSSKSWAARWPELEILPDTRAG